MSGPTFSFTCPCCEAVIEVKSGVEPAESHYGADADSNRGIFVPAQIIPEEPPEACYVCNYTFTKEELDRINTRLSKAADEWKPEAPDFDTLD